MPTLTPITSWWVCVLCQLQEWFDTCNNCFFPPLIPAVTISSLCPYTYSEEWVWLKSLPSQSPSHHHPDVTDNQSLQKLLLPTIDTFLHNLNITAEVHSIQRYTKIYKNLLSYMGHQRYASMSHHPHRMRRNTSCTVMRWLNWTRTSPSSSSSPLTTLSALPLAALITLPFSLTSQHYPSTPLK